MAHNIWIENGKAHAAYARQAAWHKLGTVTPDAMTWQDAMTKAGLDWTVALRDLYAFDGDRNAVPVPGRGVFRSTDGACLGVVGMQYTLIQNRDAFDFVDTLLEAESGAHYEAAGALGSGERIWCLARVPGGDFTIKGTDDKHETFMLFVTSHDGSTSAQAKLTDVRVVCQNTLNMALSQGASSVRVKHTRDAERKLDHAKRLMSGVVQDARGLQEKLDLLASRRMTRDSMLTILDRVFPKPEADTGAGATRRQNILGDVLRLYESNDNNAFPQLRGTAYNLLNAVTEYTDHERSARVTDGRGRAGYNVSQARAENALFGTGERVKAQALEVILAGTKDAPSQTRTIYTAPAVDPTPALGGILGSIIANHESGDLFNN